MVLVKVVCQRFLKQCSLDKVKTTKLKSYDCKIDSSFNTFRLVEITFFLTLGCITIVLSPIDKIWSKMDKYVGNVVLPLFESPCTMRWSTARFGHKDMECVVLAMHCYSKKRKWYIRWIFKNKLLTKDITFHVNLILYSLQIIAMPLTSGLLQVLSCSAFV